MQIRISVAFGSIANTTRTRQDRAKHCTHHRLGLAMATRTVQQRGSASLRVQELEAAIAASRLRSSELGADIRNRRRIQQNQDRKDKRQLQAALDTALIILCATAPSHSISQAFLRIAFPRGSEEGIESMVEQVELRYLQLPPETIVDIMDSTDSTMPRTRYRQAKTFLEEYHLRHWVERQNLKRGVAPPLNAVCTRRLYLRHTSREPLPPALPSVGKSASYKRLHRFRRKWQLHMGTCPARVVLPVNTLRQKAMATSADLFEKN